MRPISSRVLLGVVAGAAGAFALLSRAVAERETKPVDRAIRKRVQTVRTTPSDKGAEAAGPLGKDWFLGPLAIGIGTYLWHREAGIRAVTPVAAAAIASAGSHLLEYATHLQGPPPGHPDRDESSFPSGHAFQTSAVSLTTAYVLAREGLVPEAPAFAVAAALAIVSPGSRLYLDRHWASDVVGGWLLGVATAATCAAAYDSLLANHPPERLSERADRG